MPKILVVDDVADNVELLVYALEDQGYEVLKAFDGFEALADGRDRVSRTSSCLTS